MSVLPKRQPTLSPTGIPQFTPTDYSSFFLAGAPVSWSSKKQPSTALSSMEAEYMALTHSSREAIWLRRLLDEVGLPQDRPTTIHVDNQGAIAFAQNPVHHGRSKHIDLRHHFVRD